MDTIENNEDNQFKLPYEIQGKRVDTSMWELSEVLPKANNRQNFICNIG